MTADTNRAEPMKGLAEAISRRVAELPDRNSPEDWPEAMLVTHEELQGIVAAELESRLPQAGADYEARMRSYLASRGVPSQTIEDNIAIARSAQADAAPSEPKCSACGNDLPPESITFSEEHGPCCGNCGKTVGLPSPTPSDAAVQQPVALPFAILADEIAALQRFYETCEDAQPYDVPAPMMKRLAEIGLVRRVTAAIYEFTDFGLSVVNGDFASPLPTAPAGAREAIENAIKQTWQMVDPYKPDGQPGSYARGQYSGIVAALQTLRQNLDAALAAAPAPARMPLTQDRLADIVRRHLGGVYHCTRVWEAWTYNTMSESDFEPAEESDLAEEVADEILAAIEAEHGITLAPSGAKGE